MTKRPNVSALVSSQSIPKMFKVRQIFPRPKIEVDHIPSVIDEVLSHDTFATQIKPGMSIAITAGSRGIANIALITKAIVDFVKKQGASPFIVPAMGSHGGATAQGQTEILRSYHITEKSMGCPIISSMEITKIGVNEEGMDVYIDKHAAAADGIIVACRIKPHSAFRGPYESGIMKMMAIGLGKQYGAETCHQAGFGNMAKYVPMFGKAIIEQAPILFALAVIENAFDETYKIVAVDADEIAEKEPLLLEEAFKQMGKLYSEACDVLIVDQLGKNFSGDGMDPNITGTYPTEFASGGLDAQHICVLDLSDETHGNANGIGLASVITQRAYQKIDIAIMYPNAITSTVLDVVKIPLIMENDKEAIQLCIKAGVDVDKKNPRIIRIPNTLHIEHIMLSEAFYEEAKKHPNLVIQSEPEHMAFDEKGNLW